MFSIEVKFKVSEREVPPERFAALFLSEAFRGIVDDMIPKLVPAQPETVSIPQPRQPEPKVEPRVVAVEEAARLLGLSPATIRAWVHRRKIASVHLGRRVVIPREAINDVLFKGLTPAREER